MATLGSLLINFIVLIHVTWSKVDDVRDVRELFEFDDKLTLDSRQNVENPGLNTIVNKIFRKIFNAEKYIFSCD